MSVYGQKIPGIEYPVVNERAVRATAGIMFLIGAFVFSYTFYTKDYAFMYIVVPLFWTDFFLKAVFAPKYSIFGFVGRFLVKNQKPEYVGALQKRFAWSIGLMMASLMMIFAIGMGIRGALPMTICSICLSFMWMETALGVCVGCKIYGYLLRKGIIAEPAVRPACPGGACSVGKK